MMYSIWNVKDNEYKLRLNARACVDLEKKLGTNPLNLLMQAGENQLPELSVLLDILHASLQPYQHNITVDKVYDIYDDYVDDGNSLTDLIPVVIDIFRASGFIKEDDKSKNAKKRVENK